MLIQGDCCTSCVRDGDTAFISLQRASNSSLAFLTPNPFPCLSSKQDPSGMKTTYAAQSDLTFPIHVAEPHRSHNILPENEKHMHSERLSTWHQKCFNCSRAHSKNYSPINYMQNYNLLKVFLRFPTEQVIGCKGHHKALEKLKSVWPQESSDDFLSAVTCNSHIREAISGCKSSYIQIRKITYRTT